MVDTDTERGPLMPMPTTATEDMASAMEVMADTDTERGPLMPMPTTATEDMASAMEVMVDTDTARGPLMPMPTTATVDTDTARGLLMPTTVMEAMAVLATVMVPMDMASNFTTKHKNSHRTKNLHFSIPDLNLFLGKSHYYHELNKIF